MILEGCVCNWNIPGVDELPAHHHYERFEAEPERRMVPDISIWVPWKQVARELTVEAGSRSLA